jgi:hypothetical protein
VKVLDTSSIGRFVNKLATRLAAWSRNGIFGGTEGSISSQRVRALTLSLSAGLLLSQFAAPSAAAATRFAGPTSSQPLALTADGGTLLVVNPDNNSLTIFDVKNDNNVLVDKVKVERNQMVSRFCQPVEPLMLRTRSAEPCRWSS